MKGPFKDTFDSHEGPEMRNPFMWNNRGTPYDERSSCYVNVGVQHGVGKAQPIGHEGNPAKSAETFPLTSKSIMDFQKKKTITVKE